MELNFNYKEGCYLFNGTSSPEVVIHKTTYKLVTIQFQDWGDYKPFTYIVYDLTNKIDIELLNERYTKTASEQDPDKRYGIQLGTIVEYDYLKMIYLRIVDKKILSFTLQRPLLFDYIKARDKYLVADALNNIAGLRSEFSSTWEQYFRIPLQSQEKIDWDIISPPIPLDVNVNQSLIQDELGDKPASSITVYDILGFIDTETFSKIPNDEIKDEISKLINKTLEIAKENGAIGKEEPNKFSKPKIEKFNVEATYIKNGEQFTDVVEIEATSEFEAFDLAKKDFYDKHEGENDVELQFVSRAEKPIEVVPKEEKVSSEVVEEVKPKKKKKTQEEILAEIDEVNPEDLLSLLEDI